MDKEKIYEEIKDLESKTSRMLEGVDNYIKNSKVYEKGCLDIVNFYTKMNKNNTNNLREFFNFIDLRHYAIRMYIGKSDLENKEVKEILLDILHTYDKIQSEKIKKVDENFVFMACMVFLNYNKDTINMYEYDYNKKMVDGLYVDSNVTNIMYCRNGSIFRRRNYFSNNNRTDFRVKVKKDDFQKYLETIGCFECDKDDKGRYKRTINIINYEMFTEIKNKLLPYKDIIYKHDFDSKSFTDIQSAEQINKILKMHVSK